IDHRHVCEYEYAVRLCQRIGTEHRCHQTSGKTSARKQPQVGTLHDVRASSKRNSISVALNKVNSQLEPNKMQSEESRRVRTPPRASPAPQIGKCLSGIRMID